MLIENDSVFVVLSVIAVTFLYYVVLCPVFLKLLAKFNWRESLKADNADLHSHKAGTFTSGGILIVWVASSVSLLLAGVHIEIMAKLTISFILFSFVGLIDDSLKILYDQGLNKSTKMGLLAFVSLLIIILVPMYQVHSLGAALFALLIILGTSNSVNLTDGVDGLATSVCIIVLTVYLLAMLGISNTHWFSHLPSDERICLTWMTACVLGSCLGFLVFNRHPATLFMGDTGSLALGGFIAMLSLKSSSPFLLILIGLIFVVEAMSVIIQVFMFKWKGQRIFLRAPIHHHFEKLGWAENQIVVCFSLISACAGIVALLV